MSGWTYAKSGVNIDQKSEAIEALVNEVSYKRDGIGQAVRMPGLFASLIDFGDRYITMATDGVGSKLLIAEELNKAAAHQPMDTAKFVKNLYACLDAYEKCNEVDEDKEYVEKNKANVMKFRTFLMYAGQFNFQNHNFSEAYKAYDAWLNFPKTQKMVASEPAVLNDTVFDKRQVAYYACLAAYQGKEYDKVATHIEEALQYDKEAKTVRQLHLMMLLEQVNLMAETAKIEESINRRIHQQMENGRREAILQEKMRAIQREMGDDSEEMDTENMRKRIERSSMSQDAKDKAMSFRPLYFNRCNTEA